MIRKFRTTFENIFPYSRCALIWLASRSPGTFIVDGQGRVKQRFFEDFYIERNTVSNLMIKLGGKNDAAVAGTKISTAHLQITTLSK